MTLKVLLVGHNESTLARLQSALASDEVEISATSKLGPAAVTWAKIVKPDLVLVVADDGVARPVATVQALAQGDPDWTVVALAPEFERELVRQAMLAGARDVVVRTSSPVELREALHTARQADVVRRAPAGHHASHTAGTIISALGVKGGIGKTTMAVNLAVSLARETQRSVALVDLDLPYGDLAMLLGLQPTGGVVTAVSDPSILADPDLLQAQLCQGPAGVQVLTAPINGSSETAVDGAQVGTLLTRLAGLFDFVVVDTAPGFGEHTAATLDVATHTLLLTTPEPPTLRRTELALRQLAEWKYPSTKLKVVVNRATLRTGLRPEEIEALMSAPVAYWLPDEPRALQAAALGHPVALSQQNSQLARAFRDIARDLSGLREQRARVGWSFWRSKKLALATAK